MARLARVSMVVLCVLASACAYPRRSTPLSSLPRDMARPQDVPANMWHLVLVEAEVPPKKRSGLAWDEGEDRGPDPFMRIVLGSRSVWESKTLDDQTHPRWNEAPPKNLAFNRDDAVRIELWDSDGVGSDPIGIYEGRALSEAILGADTTIKLEGGATVTLRLEPPAPHAGTGIALYEVRKDALLVLEVMPRSPAERAGLRVGDRITAIDGRMVDELGSQRAESALSMAAQRKSELTVARDGAFQRLQLEPGYVWLSM